MKLGIDVLLRDSARQRELRGRRLAVLGHPPSLTSDFVPTLDAIAGIDGVRLTAAFGPQHGIRGDVQDNMVESSDDLDPVRGIPVFSLYGTTRRLTEPMLDSFDVLLVDMQDLGCRIYTFLTTLLYAIEDCARRGKAIWVLDRPNPIGRPVEGWPLRRGWYSFVGHAPLPIRHGLTLGEVALWYASRLELAADLHVIAMEGYDPTADPGYGWPMGQLSWVNPSPNAPSLSMARCYPGTVLGEGTVLSEGRGTTRPLEVLGAPDLKPAELIEAVRSIAPEWLRGCRLRPCFFQPTFQKHQGVLCRGVQIHVDPIDYDHSSFRPFRLVAAMLRATRWQTTLDSIWRVFEYEYERDRLAIDLISGGPELRDWVEGDAPASALDSSLLTEEAEWARERAPFFLYPG